jgi:alpha-N-arabinofuranosidase
MDGDWQLGHKSAEDYAKQVALTAAGMRQIDPSIELVACGSSSHDMPEFGTWERTVLEHAYDLIDFVSCHAYYYPHDGDMESFLASAVDMDSFIKDVISNIDAVRSQRHSDHQVNISFDEWNIWYSEAEPSKNPEGIGNWPVAPRLLEDVYTVADAVVFGDLLMTLLKNADRVRSASLAQLVNVIAPIMTEHGGPAWKQTTFFPFALTAAAAKGGTVLEPKTSSDTMPTQRFNDVSAVNSIAVRQPDGSLSVFAVNRSMKNPAEFRIKLPVSLAHTLDSVTASTLNDADINATNTLEHQDRVSMKDNSTVAMNGGGEVTLQLPPVSWTVVSLKKAPTL